MIIILHLTSCSVQLLLGCFCLKSVTAYLPKALIDAYLSAAALLVIVSQFTFIFDVVLDFHRSSRDIFCVSKFIISKKKKKKACGISKRTVTKTEGSCNMSVAKGYFCKSQLWFALPFCCLE